MVGFWAVWGGQPQAGNREWASAGSKWRVNETRPVVSIMKAVSRPNWSGQFIQASGAVKLHDAEALFNAYGTEEPGHWAATAHGPPPEMLHRDRTGLLGGGCRAALPCVQVGGLLSRATKKILIGASGTYRGRRRY